MLFKWQGNVSLLLEPDLCSTSGIEAGVIGNVKLISWHLYMGTLLKKFWCQQ